MDSAFRKTAAQQQALKLLGGGSRYVLLFGGSRSGKTFILVYALLVRALRAPGSRHAILRLHANSVRQSVLMDTLPKVVRLAFPRLRLAEVVARSVRPAAEPFRNLVRRPRRRGARRQDSRQGVQHDLLQRMLRDRL